MNPTMFKKSLCNVEIKQVGISKHLNKKIFSQTTNFKKNTQTEVTTKDLS